MPLAPQPTPPSFSPPTQPQSQQTSCGNSPSSNDVSMEVASIIIDHQGPLNNGQQFSSDLGSKSRMAERKISARTEVGMSLEKLTIKEGIVSTRGQSVIQSKWNGTINGKNNSGDDLNCITNIESRNVEQQ